MNLGQSTGEMRVNINKIQGLPIINSQKIDSKILKEKKLKVRTSSFNFIWLCYLMFSESLLLMTCVYLIYKLLTI